MARIFVGLHEIGDRTALLSKGFKELGHEVSNVIYDPTSRKIHPLKKGDYDYDTFIKRGYGIPPLIQFLKHIKFDLFVFIRSGSFTSDALFHPVLKKLAYIDMKLLKSLDKRIISIVNGSRLRSDELLLRDMRNKNNVSPDHIDALSYFVREYGGNPRYPNLNKIRAMKINKYADAVFSTGWDGLLLEEHNISRQLVDPAAFEFQSINRDVVKIVHAPTSRGNKGTEFVIKAIDKLQLKNDFEFLLLEDEPGWKVREILKDTDILVDQLIYPGYGTVAVEAMATGNAVLGSAIPGLYGCKNDLPIVTSTPSTIEDNLQKIIDNKDLRRNLQHQGRRFVSEYHDYKKECERILKTVDLKGK